MFGKFLRKALYGAGVDGVGAIFPFFYAFFAFLRIFSLFFAFLHFSSLFSSSPKGQGQTPAIYCKNGEFHSDPVCTDPVQNLVNFKILRKAKVTSSDRTVIGTDDLWGKMLRVLPFSREPHRQTKRQGPKRKVHEFRPFL